MAETFNVYCDESCHLPKDQSSVMVLGCIWCRRDRVLEVSRNLRKLKQESRLATREDYRDGSPFELKWQKVSASKLDYYLSVVDYFFDEAELHFRGVLIPDKSKLNHAEFPGQDHDTWYYKMLFRMLEPIIDPQHRYRVYLDIKDTRSEEKRRKLEEVLRNKRYDFTGQIIERVQQVRSDESELMQVADLLLGAVCYHNRGLTSNSAKVELVRRIQRRSGKQLTATTWMKELKFNLLRWTPQEQAGG